jgi:hypothetical protein
VWQGSVGRRGRRTERIVCPVMGPGVYSFLVQHRGDTTNEGFTRRYAIFPSRVA